MNEDNGKNCQINIWNQLSWDLDVDTLREAMLVCARHAPQAYLIDIYPQEREPMELSEGKKYFRDGPGWIEWHINVKYHGGGALTIALIQRTIGAKYETHT